MNKCLKPGMCHKSTALGHFPGQCLKIVIRKSNFRNYIHPKASSEAVRAELASGAGIHSGQRDFFSSVTA